MAAEIQLRHDAHGEPKHVSECSGLVGLHAEGKAVW